MEKEIHVYDYPEGWNKAKDMLVVPDSMWIAPHGIPGEKLEYVTDKEKIKETVMYGVMMRLLTLS